MRRFLLLGLLFLASCSRTQLSPSEPPPISETVRAEWVIAQEKVVTLAGPRASAICPEAFQWREHVGMFVCPPSSALKQGCFGPDAPGGPRVDWDTTAPSIVRHESGHAILWALGDPRWDCFEHNDPGNPNFEERCAGLFQEAR